jgi:hypothetical protein
MKGGRKMTDTYWTSRTRTHHRPPPPDTGEIINFLLHIYKKPFAVYLEH